MQNGRWRNFLDSLATPGGFVFVFFMIMCFGAAIWKMEPMLAVSIVSSASTAIFTIANSRAKTNQEQTAGTTTATTEITTVEKKKVE